MNITLLHYLFGHLSHANQGENPYQPLSERDAWHSNGALTAETSALHNVLSMFTICFRFTWIINVWP